MKRMYRKIKNKPHLEMMMVDKACKVIYKSSGPLTSNSAHYLLVKDGQKYKICMKILYNKNRRGVVCQIDGGRSNWRGVPIAGRYPFKGKLISKALTALNSSNDYNGQHYFEKHVLKVAP